MNRLLAGEPLDCRVLGSAYRANNPFPAEAALLAHCVMDPARVAQIETINVTPPCHTLLDVIQDFGALVRNVGLASVVLELLDPADDAALGRVLTRKTPLLEHIDVYDLATLVDSVRVVELTAIGDFDLVVTMMRGQLKPADKKKRMGKATRAEIVEPARPDMQPTGAPAEAPWNRTRTPAAHS